jgi:hypothetical protein
VRLQPKRWFLTNFCAGASYSELNDAAERIGPGADGLLAPSGGELLEMEIGRVFAAALVAPVN